MRRLRVLITIVVAGLLLLPAAAFAVGPPKAMPYMPGAGPVGTNHVPAQIGVANLSPSFVLSGAGVIKLNIYDGYGAGQDYAQVQWLVDNGTDFGTGKGTTDLYGRVELTGVPEAVDGSGAIVVQDLRGWISYGLSNLSWPASGMEMVIEPGRQTITITAGGDWAKRWRNALVDFYSTDGSRLKRTSSQVPRATVTATTTNGWAYPLDGEVTGGAVYFYSNEGRELDTSGLTVVSGQQTARTLKCNEYGSPRIYPSDTSWASGKPGSTFKLFFKYFPAAWVNRLSGCDYETGKASAWSVNWTSPGKSAVAKTLKVPTSATPGHTYVFKAQHTSGPLSLEYPYQVCTLDASDTTVTANQKIRLSGVVPVEPGHTKKVHIYKRATAAGQPEYYGYPYAVPGWTKIVSINTNGEGYYSTFVTPGRTTYYCGYYEKDNIGHWKAWTAVRKVTRN
jgi:hypothetical protein